MRKSNAVCVRVCVCVCLCVYVFMCLCVCVRRYNCSIHSCSKSETFSLNFVQIRGFAMASLADAPTNFLQNCVIILVHALGSGFEKAMVSQIPLLNLLVDLAVKDAAVRIQIFWALKYYSSLEWRADFFRHCSQVFLMQIGIRLG